MSTTVGLFIQWYGAPLIMVPVSIIYFLTDARRPAYGMRLLSSIHGCLGALLSFCALGFHAPPGGYRPDLAVPYAALYLLPLLSILIALFSYRGNPLIHLLQAPNILALGWALFVGGMAVTGDWL